MTEYIDREAVIKWIDYTSDGCSYLETGVDFAKRDINAIPAADVAPVVRGRWVRDEYGVIHCSVCNAYLKDEEYENHTFKKCYYCGADMREVQDG